MAIIAFLQSYASPALTVFFKIVTFLGNETFYLLALPLIYWFWERKKAKQLVFIVMLSLLVNFIFKEMLHMPRPIGVAMIEQGGYGFPSGHAQGTMTLWLSLSLLAGKRWLYWLSGIIVFFVGLSRLYLGVHCPSDVLGGWLIALVLVGLYFSVLYPLFIQAFSKINFLNRQIMITAVTVILLLIYPKNEAVAILGIIYGMSVGMFYAPDFDKVRFSGKSILIVLAGLAGLIILYVGLKYSLGSDNFSRFIRYALVGGWITGIIPAIQNRWLAIYE